MAPHAMWAQAIAAAAIVIPLGLDLYLPVPDDNPLRAEQIALGRRLFSDRRLSRDGSRACSSCHNPARAFADSRPIAVGVFGRPGRRNAPALINRGYGRAFFWDGRASSLEAQVLVPITDPNEMDLSLEEAARRVGLAPEAMSRALASFVRSILSGDSRFDRFVAGERNALTPAERRGLQVFRGRGNCTACHVGPNFTDERTHNTGIAWNPAASAFTDRGRFDVTGRPADDGAFKTPTLREIARTAPYMHDGSLPSLEAVIAFYDQGGRPNPFLDEEIRPLRLSADERRDLAAFLRVLSGRSLNR
jgi:cytochrome c peroxidase